MGMAVVASGIPVYILGVVWKNKPESFLSLVGKSIIYFYDKTS
jgi:hypothetical protein